MVALASFVWCQKQVGAYVYPHSSVSDFGPILSKEKNISIDEYQQTKGTMLEIILTPSVAISRQQS